MRIFVFEEDPSMLHLLTVFLENKGHKVQGFLDQYSCPLYQLQACACPAEKPCAGAVIVNTRLPNRGNIQVLVDQDRKGCKLPNSNKAVMSANMTEEIEREIESHGFTVIKKPFRLATVANWLTECSERLN